MPAAPRNTRFMVPRGSGFALVSTVLLLVLLVGLAVGMLSLSAVSLWSSGRQRAETEARANARLALMLALGELQKLAGPDQRITATADLAGTADGGALAAGELPGNQLAVDGREKGLSAVQFGTRHWTGVWRNRDAPEEIFTRTPAPEHLGWLVSGNEGRTPASTDFLANGRSVVLVGGNSAGDAPDRHVAAPLVEISGKKGAAYPAGRYAWWVGDEGVKAKLNLLPAGAPGAVVTEELLAAPRRGWENVKGLEAYPVPGTEGEAAIPKLVSLNQAGLLSLSVKRVFHAATTESLGVLSDPLRGGLKLDLSAYLGGVVNSPVAEENLIPLSVAPDLKGPKWAALKGFQNLAGRLDGGGLTVKPAADDGVAAIAPVIAELRILLGVKLVPKGGDSYQVHPCVKIAVALANPYPFPLRWDGGLELEIRNATDPLVSPTRIYGASGTPAILPQRVGEPAVLNQAVFVIPPATLPPGEARTYTNAGPVARALSKATSRVEIAMLPFTNTDPADFSNSVSLSHPSTNKITGNLVLAVREEQITSQIDVELRSAGTSGILRRLERFELDNPVFELTRRMLDRTLAAQFTRPFPLQLYQFRLRQPDSGGLRAFADFNLQATRFRKPLICYNPPPYGMRIAESPTALSFAPPGGDAGVDFASDPGGLSAAADRTVLFSPPPRLVSLAQLQHADLTADDGGVSVAHQPGNAVGNSHASPFVKRSLSIERRSDFTIRGFAGVSEQRRNYYDMSYLLNAALWDGYFFSTIPRGASAQPLNPRILRMPPEGPRDGHLLIDGAFNVNSVEKDAWIALLAGSKHLAHPADGKPGRDALYPRSLAQPTPSAEPPSGSGDDSFSGFRRLTDAQIERLAGEITRQVRLRGPFVSLAHFVNRALVGVTENPELGRSGALQAALDNSGANLSPDGALNAFSGLDPARDRVDLQAENGGAPRADMPGSDPTRWPNGSSETLWPTTSRDENPGSVAGILADREMLTDPDFRSEQGFRSTGIPGWITQADLLQVIGPSLAARSDTFRIRAYGESLDPATGRVAAKAWCEAVVQRMPDYVDAAQAAETRGPGLSGLNRTFGRRFQVISFRWLRPDEI